MRLNLSFPLCQTTSNLTSLCPVLSGFMLALESWHHELIQDGSGVLAESGNVRQCYGNVWMAMDGKMWQRGHVVSPGPGDRDIIHHNAAPWCNESPGATKTPRPRLSVSIPHLHNERLSFQLTVSLFVVPLAKAVFCISDRSISFQSFHCLQSG